MGIRDKGLGWVWPAGLGSWIPSTEVGNITAEMLITGHSRDQRSPAGRGAAPSAESWAGG